MLLAACSMNRHPPAQPLFAPPLRVQIIAPIPTAPLSCEMATLPDPVIIVGFPTEERIYVSKTDMVGLLTYEAQIARWARSVNDCLKVHIK